MSSAPLAATRAERDRSDREDRPAPPGRLDRQGFGREGLWDSACQLEPGPGDALCRRGAQRLHEPAK